MQLVINTYGAYLRKKNDCFIVLIDDKEQEVPMKKVDNILITTSAYVSTDAIKFAVDNNIDVVFLDHFGDPYGRVWHSKLGSTTLIRRKQLELYNSVEGLNLAKEWIDRKLENQINLLKKLKSTRPEKEETIKGIIAKIEEQRSNLGGLTGTIDAVRQQILGMEGMSSKNYFEALSGIMPERFRFDGRSRDPAKDEFNCLLNYGYGVLYSRVEKACIIAGLDPYIGFMHTDNYNKKSLVFDLIEMYRTYVDETVVYLFSKRMVQEEYFDKIPDGLTLNKEGKKALIEALNDTFEKRVNYRGREIKNIDVIQFECHRIANKLIGRGDAEC
ncbi:MAG: CRISPR-associated endonuclease Cas1 [Candidatus Altiarchaeia archaeon]